MAFFSKKKKPLVQVLANNEVVIQSVSKAVCDQCGTGQHIQANGHIQKMNNGIYKISMIEFLTIPSKSVITVMFSYLNKAGEAGMGSMVNAEGFIGIRKL